MNLNCILLWTPTLPCFIKYFLSSYVSAVLYAQCMLRFPFITTSEQVAFAIFHLIIIILFKERFWKFYTSTYPVLGENSCKYIWNESVSWVSISLGSFLVLKSCDEKEPLSFCTISPYTSAQMPLSSWRSLVIEFTGSSIELNKAPIRSWETEVWMEEQEYRTPRLLELGLTENKKSRMSIIPYLLLLNSKHWERKRSEKAERGQM